MLNRSMPGLQGLAHAFEWVEAMFSIIAGPMTVASGLIAPIGLFLGVDLLHQAWLAVPWALAMASGLDIWLAVAAVWLVEAAGRGRWRAVFGWGLLVSVLAAIGFQANWVVMYASANGISDAQALAQIGVSSSAWTLERAAMVPILVIISAVMRRFLSKQSEPAIVEPARVGYAPRPVEVPAIELAPAVHMDREHPDMEYLSSEPNRRRVSAMLKADPSLTAPRLAERLNVSPATANALILALTVSVA